MGRVFLVVNADTKDCLAVKVVNVFRKLTGRMNVCRSGEIEDSAKRVRQELRYEAELQRRLDHPHIANVYGVRYVVDSL